MATSSMATGKPLLLGLLDRLDRDIAHSRLPREIPHLRAERAVLLARLGDFDRARQDLAFLRGLPDSSTNPVLGAWMWLGEGVLDFFESMNQRARDRVQRARALAVSAKSQRLIALTSAWCAHFDYGVGEFTSMVHNLADAFRAAAFDNHSALTRACVMVAVAYHCGGSEELAQPWYARARNHATREGDGVSLSSIAYNLAALRISSTRLLEHFGVLDKVLAKRALLGVESSAQLDLTVHARALAPVSSIQRAQILCVLEQFSDALTLFDQHYEEAIAQGLARDEAQLQADRAWCLYRLGRGDEARDMVRAAAAAITWSTERDGKAIAHAQLARTCAALGLAEDARSHAREAQVQYADYLAYTERLRANLAEAQLDALYPREPPAAAALARGS
jgi:tetratricopeptide (TPR) repeat protein